VSPTASHCDTLQHTVAYCNTLQHTAIGRLFWFVQVRVCGMNMYTCVSYYNTPQHTATCCNTLRHPATHCNALQYTATHCNTLHQTTMGRLSWFVRVRVSGMNRYACVFYRNTLQHAATQCNELQHNATYCDGQNYLGSCG